MPSGPIILILGGTDLLCNLKVNTMETIENEAQYLSALERIEKLLKFVDDDTPSDDVNAMELDRLSDLVEAYERVHFPIGQEIIRQEVG